MSDRLGDEIMHEDNQSDGVVCHDTTPNRSYKPRLRGCLKTPFLRLKVLENKGLGESWNHVETAVRKRNSIEKSPARNFGCPSHSVGGAANEQNKRHAGRNGRSKTRNLRGVQLGQFRLSSINGRVGLRVLSRRRVIGLHERLRVAGSSDVSRGGL